MKRDVTVVIPSIPARAQLLERALRSCWTQDVTPAAVSVALDIDRAGSGPTRTRALRAARTTWVAFLDDDDELRHFHLARLLEVAEETGADVVAPWFVILGPDGAEHPEWDPFPEHRGRPWSIDDPQPHIFPITCLVRNEVAQLGEFPRHHDNGWAGDDYAYWCQLGRAGAKVVTIPDATWWWHHHGRNTSGMADRAAVIYQ